MKLFQITILLFVVVFLNTQSSARSLRGLTARMVGSDKKQRGHLRRKELLRKKVVNQIKRESAINIKDSKVSTKKQGKLSSRLKTEGETKQNKLTLKLKANTKAEKDQKKSTLALKLKSAKNEEELDEPALLQPKQSESFISKKTKARKFGLARKLTQTGSAKKGRELGLKLKDSGRKSKAQLMVKELKDFEMSKARILLDELAKSKVHHRRKRRAAKATPVMLQLDANLENVDDALEATTEAAVEAEAEAKLAESIAAEDPTAETELLAHVAEGASDVANTEDSLAGVLAAGGEVNEELVIQAENVAVTEEKVATEAAETAEKISGSVADDPHFTGFDGSTYDFQGKINHVYNLVSDKYFQLNARFIAAPRVSNTYMGAVGIRVHENTIVIEPFSLTINGEVKRKGAFELKTKDEKDGNAGAVYAEKGFVSVVTKGFMVSVKVITKDGMTYLNVETSVQSDHLLHPHGLLGQTARYLLSDEDASPVHLPHSNKWAAGFIEGTPMDYMVKNGILGLEFTYNRFGLDAPTSRSFMGPRFAVGRASHVPKHHHSQ